MELLAKVEALIAREKAHKDEQARLNDDIGKFIATELKIDGPATLLDISKKLLESTIEESRIVKP